jgi:hypothetical protein
MEDNMNTRKFNLDTSSTPYCEVRSHKEVKKLKRIEMILIDMTILFFF